MNEKDKNTSEKDVTENVAPQTPKALKRAGIERIESNLQPGQMLNIPGETIWLFFQSEIQKKFWVDGGSETPDEKI